MSKFILLLIFIINFFFTQSGHCSLSGCHGSDITSSKKIENTTAVAFHDKQEDAQKSAQQSQNPHHFCSACHAHLIVFVLKNSDLPNAISSKKTSQKIFYDNFYSYLSISPFFRPPIA
jgi:hypothetical protein